MIKDVFKNELIDIFHIGSTSIPTIVYAKPINDIIAISHE
ncbi:GrpB family protein [Neobacillus niacini]